jgi:hypothetical protein
MMLKYSLEQGRLVAIFTSLVGMNKDNADMTCGLLRQYRNQIYKVYIHLPDASNHMPGWKKSDEWDYALKQFKELYNEKLFREFVWMTMDEKNNVHPDVDADEILISGSKMISRAGSLGKKDHNIKSIEIDGPVICGHSPFYDENVLLPNGDVVLCCMDFGLRYVLGNLLVEEYHQIHERNSIHGKNAMFGITQTICKQCTRAIEYNLTEHKNWQRYNNSKDSLLQLLKKISRLLRNWARERKHGQRISNKNQEA